ncbi:antitoxin Xre-like helix-turn-helix domain-containing protein [Vulgatibacter incomptus]|uniref:Uncharacterized protein n=1 Tax=Vulgatibacter incomptus TaxID=1391653 RepID=A0A0K1PDP7_9BACT|nr:antitoxin Xre-like helix-turn-helix domain-containing protein [Vulgatibacter incomptus]AKU91645.1 hypothetical protein AKJ08_2032 [Vulgatibacter incomptus]
MEQLEQITRMLGGARILGKRPDSDRDFVEIVREGLPFSSFQSAVRSLGMTEEEAREALGFPRRTLSRRKLEQGRLRAAESERVLRLARVGTRAIDVLGDANRAVRWLRAPNRGLGGEAPLELLDTDVGTQGVLDELTRLDHGVFS